MPPKAERYVHALTYRWLTPLYDPLVALTTRERDFKRELVQEMDLRPGESILDVGCGTGTLAVMLARSQPAARVIGIDGDPEVLARAQDKVVASGLTVELREGLADNLSFDDRSFDKVVSTLVFHHLAPATKRRALAEILRVLKPGGSFFLADLGRVPALLAQTVFLPFRLFDGIQNTADNLHGRLPRLIEEAGFVELEEQRTFLALAGPVTVFRAQKS